MNGIGKDREGKLTNAWLESPVAINVAFCTKTRVLGICLLRQIPRSTLHSEGGGRGGQSALFFSGSNTGTNPRETDISKLKLIIIRLLRINNTKHLFSISVNCELGNMCRVKP